MRDITILLAEDEPLVLEFAAAVLQRAGYLVRAVSQPRAALALLLSPHEHIDLLLTDVVMPGLSGPDLAREGVAARPGLRVAFMSGQCASFPPEFSGCSFVHKPFRPADLVDAVRTSLAAVCAGT